MKSKFFTPQEANRRLPYVRTIVQEIINKGKSLQALSLMPHQLTNIRQEEKQLQEQIESLMEELEELGCYYKDWNFEVGLVDFPAIIDGREVLLCWRSDEPQVAWYHGFENGYAGRRPIPQEILST